MSSIVKQSIFLAGLVTAALMLAPVWPYNMHSNYAATAVMTFMAILLGGVLVLKPR